MNKNTEGHVNERAFCGVVNGSSDRHGVLKRVLALAIGLALPLVLARPASATGDRLLVELLPVNKVGSNRPGAPEVILRSNGIREIDVVSSVYSPAAGRVVSEPKYDGRSLNARGETDLAYPSAAFADEGDILRFEAARADALGDGIYSEKVKITFVADGLDAPASVVDYRYFSIKSGNLSPLSANEYSALTTRAVVSKDGKVRVIAGAAVRVGPATKERGHAVLDESADTGKDDDRSEVGEP
jgi:hypothetical protein